MRVGLGAGRLHRAGVYERVALKEEGQVSVKTT